MVVKLASGKTIRGKRYRANLRVRIWEGQGKRCYYCNDKISKKSFTIDHIKPISRGGRKFTVGNMVCACRRCNGIKGNLTGYEFCIAHGKMPLEGDVL